MGRPIKIHTFSNLKEMSNTEIDDRMVPLILAKLAANPSWRTGLTLLSDNTGNVGTWYNSIRDEDVGTHPTTGPYTQTDYSLDQNTTAEDTSTLIRPVNFTSGNLREMNLAALATDIFERCRLAYVDVSGYPVSTYYFGTAKPDTDTWVQRYTFDDTWRKSGTDGTTTYRLYQKTSDGTTASSARPLKVHYNASEKFDGYQEMSDAEISNLAQDFANYLRNTTVAGEYKISTSAPTVGTWQNVGSVTDTIANTGIVTYSRGFTGTYSRGFSGTYSRGFTGQYTIYYSGRAGGTKTKTYSRGFTGNYSRGFTGTYSRGFDGETILGTTSTTTWTLYRRVS